MSTYVLVHGAWHGAWCWEKLTPLLQEKGHRVIAPDLPGHGEDQTPFEKITLKTYVDYIKAIILDLNEPVILVGHSMGGLVISEVGAQIPEKIQKLIYLAAFVPSTGESLTSLAQKQKPTRFSKQMNVIPEDFAMHLPFDQMKSFAFHQYEKADFDLIAHRFRPDPLLPWGEPVSLSEHFDSIPKRYIECVYDRALPISTQRIFQQTWGCEVKTLLSDHSPFYSMPENLARLLT